MWGNNHTIIGGDRISALRIRCIQDHSSGNGRAVGIGADILLARGEPRAMRQESDESGPVAGRIGGSRITNAALAHITAVGIASILDIALRTVFRDLEPRISGRCHEASRLVSLTRACIPPLTAAIASDVRIIGINGEKPVRDTANDDLRGSPGSSGHRENLNAAGHTTNGDSASISHLRIVVGDAVIWR